MKKLSPKTQNQFIIDSFFLAGLECLVRVSGLRLRCGPVKSTKTILFQMHPLLMLQCYIIMCQQIMQ